MMNRALTGSTADDADAAAGAVMPHTTEPTRPARLQDLAAAVLATEETDEILQLLVTSARRDLDGGMAALVLPDGEGGWFAEVVDGERRADVLGRALDDDSPLHTALSDADVEAISQADAGDLLGASGGSALIAPVAIGPDACGALIVARVAGESRADLAAAREHLDAIAALTTISLGAPLRDAEGLDDERGRIARDLHDLAIQELFAVGMELESLQAVLADPTASGLQIEAARSVETSVRGVERAVAQIRQIVQSLRRERSEATLAERLRHETALATAGLGFVPSLRLPADPAQLDTEVSDEIGGDIVAVVRECLANAARHAHASAVAVSISIYSEGVDRVVQVAVSDNGRGIDPSVTRRSGLANMSSRARRHRGWVDAIPLEPGTMINWRVTLPSD